MKKRYIIKELNTNQYWCGFFLDDEWSKDATKATHYNAEWKAKDTIQSALYDQMIVIVEQPMFEIVTVYVNG